VVSLAFFRGGLSGSGTCDGGILKDEVFEKDVGDALGNFCRGSGLISPRAVLSGEGDGRACEDADVEICVGNRFGPLFGSSRVANCDFFDRLSTEGGAED
jgi:hypothetical protein